MYLGVLFFGNCYAKIKSKSIKVSKYFPGPHQPDTLAIRQTRTCHMSNLFAIVASTIMITNSRTNQLELPERQEL